MDKADTAWLLVSTALVLLMTPALGFFYGGLVRSKNALNTMMMSIASLGFVGVGWALVGYSVAFAPGTDFAGGLSKVLLRGVGLAPQGSVPQLLFMAFQGTFAIITAALISGAIVERMRFGPYLAFLTLWGLVVYAPVAHWVWGGGFLSRLGALDFAGGTVAHINAGGETERVETYRGTTVKMEFAEKVRLEIGVSDHFVEPTVRAILGAARTGSVGDGKVFVLPIEKVYRIRTGEEDQAAVTPVGT